LRRALAVTAVLFALTLAACSSQPVKSPESRKRAPAFTLKDSAGHTVQLADYRGKVVLLNFWATWCGPCKMEIPWFIEFERQYKDRGFAVLGVSMDEDGWQAVKPFLAGMNVNYRVLLGDEAVAKAYGGVESLPTSFIIDREGRIAATHIGLVSKGAYEKDLKDLL
jgi:peroxiredoxin